MTQPTPKTMQHQGQTWRRLDQQEVIESGDLVTTLMFPEPSPIHLTIGFLPRDYLPNAVFWRRASARPNHARDSQGTVWFRLAAGQPLKTGDRQGVNAPTELPPDGKIVRKSRHVWRKCSIQSILKTPPMEEPITLVDPNGRPWRCLEIGERIRPCDKLRWSGSFTEDTPRVGKNVREIRNVWRPTAPEPEFRIINGKNYRKLYPYEVIAEGDMTGNARDNNEFWRAHITVGEKASKYSDYCYYRRHGVETTTKPGPPAPPALFLNYMKSMYVIVNGYSMSDLVRYLESKE